MPKAKFTLTKIRFFILTATLLLASPALAQGPPNVANRIMENLYADQVPCASDETFGEIAASFDDAYCGLAWDTLTDPNRDLTDDGYRATGYVPLYDWETSWLDAGEVHMRAQTNGVYVSITALLTAYGMDGTAVIITFDRVE